LLVDAIEGVAEVLGEFLEQLLHHGGGGSHGSPGLVIPDVTRPQGWGGVGRRLWW
jgi:hypothetical protein